VVAIRAQLLSVAPTNMGRQRDLAYSQSYLVRALYEDGQKGEADEILRNIFAVVEKYAVANPDNVMLQIDLVKALYSLAYYLDRDSDANHLRALAIVRRLDADGKLTPDLKASVDALEPWLASKPK
jgi:hypothetical protein